MMLIGSVIAATALLASPGQSTELSPQQVFKKWSGAVVTVKSGSRSGTGFFSDRRILYTAYHVLEGAETATIIFQDGRTGSVVGALSADRERDFAILQTDVSVEGPQFGEYGVLQEGEPVTVIGSPLGLSQTVTTGVVSSKRQQRNSHVLQLSAGISPGSSGSPVFNSQGRVVGLVTSSLSQGQLLNFAISSSDLQTWSAIPLKQAFCETDQAGSHAGSVLKALDNRPKLLDLLGKGAHGYVGLKSVRVYVTEIPAALRDNLSREDIEIWLTNGLTQAGLHVRNQSDEQPRGSLDGFTPGDLGVLSRIDASISSIQFSVTALKDLAGTTSYSYLLTVDRAGAILPGWPVSVTVDRVGGIQLFGSAHSAREIMRRTVNEATGQIIDRWKYANARN